jgi:ribokinase
MKGYMIMPNRPKIIVIGSMIYDFVTKADRLPRKGETIIGESFGMYTGGKGANQAVQAARLGAQVFMVGRVGNDFMGEEIISNLQKDGVNTKFIKKDCRHLTSACCIHVDKYGNNDIILSPEANMAVNKEDVDEAMYEIMSADVLLLQLEIPFETVKYAVGKANEHKVPVILNPAPASNIDIGLFSSVEYITPNETEAEYFSNLPIAHNANNRWEVEAAAKLLALGSRNVIITLGERGAYFASSAFARHYKAFNCIHAVALAEGQDIDYSIKFANAAGALAASRMGAQPSLCTRDEITAFLKKHL